MNRPVNFYAGPSMLPLEVLETLRDQMVAFGESGLSLVETSHRSGEYDDVHNEAVSLLRELMGIPEGYSVVLVGGGATLQFSMVPLNLMSSGGHCDFTLTGSWAGKACDEAAKVGTVNVLFDGKPAGYTSLPDPADLHPSDGSAYVHLTSNETIGGIQWKSWPNTGEVPLVCDMSSDILSRPVPVERFGLIYAGAQKNLGPAGVTVVIIRDDLLSRSTDELGSYLDYRIHASKNSLYNTPPVFAIWAVKLVLERVKRIGGVEAMAAENQVQADLIYGAIDESKGFYRCPVDRDVRSHMNVVFRLPSEKLEGAFVKEAEAAGMLGLKGHRSVGGCRASIYNAMTREGVETLTAFMADFAARNR